MLQTFNILFLLLLLLSFLSQMLRSERIFNTNSSYRSLSRKKRFLVFPEGSSLQLVFCLTIPSVGMGSIFTIGWTAALAWELPHEPIHPFRKKEKALERVSQSKISSSGGWTVKNKVTSTSDRVNDFASESSYATIRDHAPKIGFSKMRYSGSPDTSYRKYVKGKYVDYRPIYDAFAIRPSVKSNNPTEEEESLYKHPVYKEVHRRTRRDLFTKIERFLNAQRLDGKACLLKAICEVSKAPEQVGTFMEEIIKAIFRVRQYKVAGIEDEFDGAANESHNCTQKYSRCASSVWSLI